MVATHEGIVVPPRDSDGISIDTDGELLAQIIPLRRRKSEPCAPEILADEPAGPLDGPDALPSLSVERSVWDEPSVELRRRAPNADPASGRPAADARLPGRRRLAPFVTGAAAVAVVGVIAVVVALALGGATGRSVSRPQQYAASRLTPRVGMTRLTGRAASRPRRSATAHHQTHPRRAGTVRAQSTESKAAVPPSTPGSSAPVQEEAPADNAPASSSPQQVAQSAPGAGYTPVPARSAEDASVNREFGFER